MKHSHLHHGFVVDASWRMNVWAQFLRLTLSLQGCPFLSRTSSFMVGSSLSSHTLLYMDLTCWMYFMQKLRASLMEYWFAMLRTYPFKAFIYLSMGYIHLVWIRPQIFNYSTSCTTKWVITSNMAGGNTFFMLQIVSVTSFLSTCIVLGSIIFVHILLNILLRLIRDMCISSCIKLWRQKGNTYWIITW
jgi:hypothetical protein